MNVSYINNRATERLSTVQSRIQCSGLKVFTNEQEILLEGYLKKAPKCNMALQYRCARQVTVTKNVLNKPYPPSWEMEKSAGIDWIKCFMKI
ncbi:hypothetical protein AVEN_133512-1 [Araneus ventricosus]|uniref:Uncharacterized protein n=1 Tax=Araneus ventricosus TaxID=182803 RepID=A0A4Y2P2R0_ARAVE|nr:hypothetical protein AVEN_133512-1 [Araneus ventricosus]